MTVIEDLQQIPAALVGQRRQRPVVDYQDIGLRQLRQRLGVVAVTASPDIKNMLLREGLESSGNSPKEFETAIKTEVAKWIQRVTMAEIKANLTSGTGGQFPAG